VLISHLAASQLPETPPQIWPPSVPVEIVPLIEPSPFNVAVSAIHLLTPYAEREMEVEVRVSAPTARKPLELALQAEGVNLKQILPPGKNSCLFRFPVPRKVVRGSVTARVVDAWPEDNTRPFAFSRVARQRVLLVDGRPGATPFEGQPYFVDKALAASGAAHGQSPFLPEVCFGLENNSGLADLTPFAAVALCGVNEVSAAAAEALASYVAKGGALIHLLNDSPIPAGSALAGAALIPAGLQYKESKDPRVIKRFDPAHPAFAAFADKDYGNLGALPWQQRFSLGETAAWRPLLTLDNGAPLLWERATAAGSTGRVMLLAHPLNRNWNDLPREPVFVPFVKHIFSYLTRQDATPAEARAVHPGLGDPRKIGCHTMPNEAVQLVVADPSEAMIGSADPDRFRAAYGLPDAALSAIATPPPPVDAPDVSRAREWWPWVAIALLAFLAMETWLATRPLASPRS
jgi:hypothetical protein